MRAHQHFQHLMLPSTYWVFLDVPKIVVIMISLYWLFLNLLKFAGTTNEFSSEKGVASLIGFLYPTLGSFPILR